jgi:DNA polymerase
VDLITIDIESYYNKDYSLTKITTEEYIRSALFEVIGLGVKVNDGSTEWASGSHAALRKYLQKFDWANAMVLAHNTLFDGAILGWHFGVKPKIWADTLSMGRALHGVEVGGSLRALAERYKLGEKGTEVLKALGKRRADFTEEELSRYGDYCVNDVELTYQLFNRMVRNFPKQELRVIDQTLRMFIEPVLELDKDLLHQHLAETRERKEALLASCGVDKAELMSNQKFAEVLTSLGVTPPMKVSPTTGKDTYAFAKSDEAFKALAEHPDDRVQALVAARLGTKSTLEETRTQRFIEIAGRGVMPIPIRYYAAHTGRFGGCLVADTEVTVYDPTQGVTKKRIVDVLLDDLVWDGLAFVSHEGVQFSGYQEVITWDGITGTPDHVVFTDSGEVTLREAMQGQHRISIAADPSQDELDSARRSTRTIKTYPAL